MRLFAFVSFLAVLLVGCDSDPVSCPNEGEVSVEDLFVSDNPSRARPTSTVVVNYTGMLEDGSEFDSGEGVGFSLSGTLSGFRVGVAGDGEDIEAMRIGSRRRIVIPPNFGYGGVEREDEDGNTLIPSCSVLTFEVELIDIVG